MNAGHVRNLVGIIIALSDRTPEAPWYAELRELYRPEQVKLLLIGESAPDPRSAERRFFYAPVLTGADNLFRGVVLALYDHRFPPGSAGGSKVPWLEQLKGDGVFLIQREEKRILGGFGPFEAPAQVGDAVIRAVWKVRPNGRVSLRGMRGGEERLGVSGSI